jgi:hypothetical protein
MLGDLMCRVLRDRGDFDVHPHASGFVACRGSYLVMSLDSGEFLLYDNTTACFVAGGRGVARMLAAITARERPALERLYVRRRFQPLQIAYQPEAL